MLSDVEKRGIDDVRSLYRTQQAAVVEALRIVQDSRGWISDEALRDVAVYLDLSPAYIESLATFYSMIFRRPVGRHVIMVCDSVACWMDGADDVIAALSEHLGIGLGETSEDGRFTLLPVVCLGACDQAPAMLIDWNLHGNVATDDLSSILSQYP